MVLKSKTILNLTDRVGRVYKSGELNLQLPGDLTMAEEAKESALVIAEKEITNIVKQRSYLFFSKDGEHWTNRSVTREIRSVITKDFNPARTWYRNVDIGVSSFAISCLHV
jgi:hypothetical protein